MGFYPIVLNLTNRKCLVVGGGAVAYRKILELSLAGAKTTVIAPEIDNRIGSLPNIKIVKRKFKPGDTKGFSLVIAATNDERVNRKIFEDAQKSNSFVNTVDNPELCSFITPASIIRGDLIISVATSGKCPSLSKKIKKELETIYGCEYAEYIKLLGDAREKIKRKYNTQQERKDALRRALSADILELIKQNKIDKAIETLDKCI